jgi:hypothetical protein
LGSMAPSSIENDDNTRKGTNGAKAMPATLGICGDSGSVTAA